MVTMRRSPAIVPLARADSSFAINSRGMNFCKRDSSGEAGGWTTGSGAGGAATGAPTGRPQLKQNFALAGKLVPQLAQAVGMAVPQLKQNFAPRGFSVWQLGQFMQFSPSDNGSR
ncbi:MAG: hypothetical protein R2844_10645 [Caldilineales bacterium]